MGWDISLMNGDDIAMVEKHGEGSNIALGGNDRAEMDVTWNYSSFYYKVLNTEMGFRWLDGKMASGTIIALEKAIEILGTVTDGDYWKPTPGNAGHILNVLLGWARQYPDAKWRVS